MDLEERARSHAALGDARRLLIVDRLALGDLTVTELADVTGMQGNLLAHHLDVLGDAGLIERRISEGDHRRRYVSLQWGRLPSSLGGAETVSGDIVFICTHNSARSQFAAAMWEAKTGERAESAGRDPSRRVHAKAVQVAAEFGVDISSAEPRGYERLGRMPVLVVSVCDRARESGMPDSDNHLHWSVPDPAVSGTLPAFRAAFSEISQRVDHLADRAELNP